MIRKLPFYAGLFLLTLCTLTLELVQTRLLSVMTWYHLAFFVISAAMFGMTAGAVWVYRNRQQPEPRTLAQDLARQTTWFSISAALSLGLEISLAPVMVWSFTSVVVFLIMALTMAAPFFFSGIAISLALTRSPFPIATVYCVDLVGAALGCLGVLALLAFVDAPSAVLLVAALGAGAAACFKASRAPGTDDIAPRFERRLPRPLALVVCFAALGLANAVTHRGLQPIVVKSFVETRSTGFLYERWNYFSRISADSRGLSRPELWGPSPLMPHDMVTEQIHLSIDGLAGTAMFRFDDQHPPVFLDYDITNLAYFLKRNGRAAIIGVGSGRDVLSAWHFGFRDVTGVEINPIFIDLLTRTEPFRSFAGIAPLAGVRLINDEARSWFARSRETFDLIQMSMIDTWAATGAGAFTLSENGLYTVDGWRHFLARLGDGGVFTVSRWHAPGDLNETGRLMSLATAALLERGIRDPGRHLFLAASGRAATLILSLEPLGEESLSTLRAACDRFGYSVILAPDQRAESDNLRGILESASREALDRFTSRADFDLTPPTDDRPFFFNLLRLDRPLAVFRVQRSGFGVLSGNLLATMTLLTILVVSLFLVVLTILVPLRPAAKASGRSLVAAGTVYFALLGLGFMFVEIGLLQRLSVLLGHPIYSLSVVLFSLILSTGVGSLAASVVRLESRAALFVSWAACTGVYLLTLVVALPGLISRFEGTGLLAHVALSLGLLAPAGLLMGFGFPVGMRMVQAIDERPTPWFWGINGAAGVLASVLAIATSLAFGISRSILLGACCYLALIVPGLYLGFRLPARARPAGR